MHASLLPKKRPRDIKAARKKTRKDEDKPWKPADEPSRGKSKQNKLYWTGVVMAGAENGVDISLKDLERDLEKSNKKH